MKGDEVNELNVTASGQLLDILLTLFIYQNSSS